MSRFVKIGRTPFISNETDRWGRELPTFMVYNSSPGYVDKDFWKELQEFENHSIAEEVAEVCMKTGMTLQGHLPQIMESLPITKRLIGRARGQVWEFNMLEKPRNYQDGDDMIRLFAVLGEKSLKTWTFVDDIRLAYLRWKCNNMNKRVLNANNAAQR